MTTASTTTAAATPTASQASLRAFEALAANPRLSDLAALARTVATHAATERTEPWPSSPAVVSAAKPVAAEKPEVAEKVEGPEKAAGDAVPPTKADEAAKPVVDAPKTGAEKLRAQANELKVTSDDASTSFGNALHVLERGPEDDAERALAAALWAHALAETPPKGRDDEDKTATDILWLATHTPFDALGLLDRALGDGAGDLWDALADRVRRIDQRKLPSLGRGEALVGAHALATSSSKVATKQAAALATEVRDPALARALAPPTPSRAEPTSLKGELAPAPRGPLLTAVLGLSGILFAMHAVSLFMRVALAFRRPAEVLLSDEGVRVTWRTELLGRTLRNRDVVIKRDALVRATREVRYPRVAFYAGLLALAVGSYIGMAFLVDGIRAASPSLLVAGLAIASVGIGLDFAFASLAPGSAGRCRVVFMPRRGAQVCVAGVDAKRADTALGILRRPAA